MTNKTDKLALAVRGGMFQAQRISYDAKGVSKIQALTGWTNRTCAESHLRGLGWVSYGERVAKCAS